MKVKNWMTPSPLTLTEDDIVKTAVTHVLRNRIRHIPILRGGTLVGIVTDRDLKRALPSVVAGSSPEEYQSFMDSTKLRDVMSANPMTCGPESDMLEVVRLFVENKFGAIPVLEDERIVGIITQTDAMQAFLQQLAADS